MSVFARQWVGVLITYIYWLSFTQWDIIITLFFTLTPTLDDNDNHSNSQTIALYLDGKSPKFIFRVVNKREFQATLLFPLGSLRHENMRISELC